MFDNIKSIQLTNKNDTKVSVSNFGAIIQSFIFRDTNIVLGFNDLPDYMSEEYHKAYPYFGAMIGRYANRIAGGRFVLDGRPVILSRNHGDHQLHGGAEGFDRKVWQVLTQPDGSSQTLALRMVSPDGEEGFPGQLVVTAHFTLDDDDTLTIRTEAVSDASTVINMTHHDYFNLNGLGTIHRHLVQIDADHILERDGDLIPTGNHVAVDFSRFDFRLLKPVADDSDDASMDHSFVCNGLMMYRPQAIVVGDHSGIRLEISSNQPVIHFYTGEGIRWMHKDGGSRFGPFSGMCFEAQIHPNAVNIPSFPTTVLHPGATYLHILKYRVSMA